MIEQRPLGRSGRTISAIALGCSNWGRDIDEEASYRLMDYAVERGITLFDTAESYGGGQSRQKRRDELAVDDEREATDEMSSSERIIGRWLRRTGARDDVTIETKVGSGGGADNIARALEGSLERMGIDRVDIYLMHSPDTRTPISETLEALTAEVKAGRVGVIGCSNYTAEQLQEALAASASGGCERFEISQPEYNLIKWRADEELFPIYEQEGLAVAPYNPIGAGFLAGEYTRDLSEIPSGSRFDIIPDYVDSYFTDPNFRIVDLLREKADGLGVHVATLAMAWVMTHPAVTAPIIGARTTEHIDGALAAYEMGLDPALRAEMSAWGRSAE